MADKYVRITHRDGREAYILPRDFTKQNVSPDKKSYADQGWRIEGYVDGTPYEGPTTARQIEARREERAAATAPAAPAPKKAE